MLSRELGIPLHPDQVTNPLESRRHMTSPSVPESVRRWRTKLDPELAAVMTRLLGEPMAGFGYCL
jgi:hypothetical protein